MKTWLSKIRLWELGVFLLCGFGCYFLWNSIQSEQQITAKTEVVLDHADQTISSLNLTLSVADGTLLQVGSSVQQTSNSVQQVAAKLLDNCHPEKGHIYTADEDKPCGTLADIARTLNTIRGTFGVVEKAGNHYDDNLTKYDGQEEDLLKNTNALLSNAGTTIDYFHELLKSHVLLLDNMQRLAGNTADTVDEVHGVVKDIHVQTTKMNQPKTRQQKILEWMPVIVKGAISTACMATGAC